MVSGYCRLRLNSPEGPPRGNKNNPDKEEHCGSSKGGVLPELDSGKRMIFFCQVLREIPFLRAQDRSHVIFTAHLRDTREKQGVIGRSSNTWPETNESAENAHRDERNADEHELSWEIIGRATLVDHYGEEDRGASCQDACLCIGEVDHPNGKLVTQLKVQAPVIRQLDRPPTNLPISSGRLP